jgi:hypothetical protein
MQWQVLAAHVGVLVLCFGGGAAVTEAGLGTGCLDLGLMMQGSRGGAEGVGREL